MEPDFKFELLPLHSPLLRQSLLVSFPPLIDMLKFSGYPYLIRGQSEVDNWLRPSPKTVQTRARSSLHPGSHGLCHYLSGPPWEQRRGPNSKPSLRVDNDARTGMPSGIPEGAMCVQRFDDSRNSAIRITYRISLRSSSMPEPRDPLLKVLNILVILRRHCEENWWGLLTGTGQRRESPAVQLKTGPPKQHGRIDKGWRRGPEDPHSVMILPQVHLRNISPLLRLENRLYLDPS